MSEYIERGRILIELAEACDKIDPSSLKGSVIREAIASLAKRINAIPAADVAEVKRGKWMMRQFGCGVCSNCHRQDHIDPLAKYCRYCGVEMCEEGRP